MSEERFQRVSELFVQAGKLGLHDRDLFLAKACNGDDELRREVEQLLSAAQEPLPFAELADDLRGAREQISDVSRSASEPHDAATMTNRPPGLTHERGTQIGPYKLLEKIGEGGFGLVYVAEQRQPVRRKVALKIIKLGMDTRQVIARFEAERQALAMMDHPNIAKVFDAGETDTGRPYFVMELVRGVPITEYCDTENLDTTARLGLFASVCRAIQHAHQKGVIHRDIKPSNVMVTLHDGVPVPKVIDFGIAKATSGELTEKTIYTLHRQMIGTPAYMSPEQAEMSGLDIDTRSDIYSLGVLLYELLTGTTPFDPQRLRSVAYGELQRIIREEEPHKPSNRIASLLTEPRTQVRGPSEPEARAEGSSPTATPASARASGSDAHGSSAFAFPVPRSPFPVPSSAIDIAKHRRTDPTSLTRSLRGDLDWIVMKCLEKDRTRRYETANSVASDIQRHLENQPVQAGPPTAAYRFRKFARRNRAVLITTTAVAASLIIGLTLATVGLVMAMQERDAAQAEHQRAEANFQKARDAVDRMLTRVAQDKLAGLPQMEPIRRELLEDALEFYQGFLREQRESADVQFDTALAYRRVGHLRQELGDYVEAEQAYRESISLLEATTADTEAPDDVHSNLAATHNTLGILLTQTGRPADAESAFRRAIEIRSTLADHSPDPAGHLANLSDTHANLGNVLAMTGRMPEAETAYRASLALMERLLRESPDELYYRHSVPGIRASLANLLAITGRPDDAEPAFRQSIDVQRGLVADYPDVRSHRFDLARSLSGLADILRESNRLDEADQAYGQTVALLQKLAAEFPAVIRYRRQLGSTLMNRAIVLGQGGKLDQAQAAFRHAIEVLRRFAGEFPEMTEHRATLASAYFNLGLSLRIAGKLDEAETALRQTLALRKALADEFPTFPDHSRQLAAIHGQLGVVLTAANRSDEAAEAYRRALTLWEELTVEFPDVHVYKRNLADLLADCPDLRLRDTRRAVVLAQKAVELAPQDGESWHTLGTVHYRAGNWQQAANALQESMRLYAGGDSTDHFFMAMTRWQLGDKQLAREWYDRGVLWMSENHPDDPQQHRFRAEAAEHLNLETEAGIEEKETPP